MVHRTEACAGNRKPAADTVMTGWTSAPPHGACAGLALGLQVVLASLLLPLLFRIF